MHRSSSSTSRASDEFMVNMLPASLGVTMASSSPLLASDHDRDLPTYANIPISDATKKEMAAMHRKSSLGENAIHLIPLLLIFCALILWLFSLPEWDMKLIGGGWCWQSCNQNSVSEYD
ncbi:hypothetical protein WN943_000740 [Citrus x changshan-huyou]|uniref:Transmembrane protein n=1 Tax=Citrus unshiu TaxID=55188 RepID=A0A2H5PDZ9_CITUN|nr:hypothetical protein CUMW_127580 [Citrus unshiu]